MHSARLTLLPLVAVALVAAGAGAQQRTPDFKWQKQIAAGKLVKIHNINGDVTVIPASGTQVEVYGYRRDGRDGDDPVRVEVVETGDGISICALKDGMRCDESGIHGRSDNRWRDERMDVEVRLPRTLEVSASSVSGDVRVTGAQGDVRAGSVSGDVRLDQLRARSVRAKSVSGRVTVAVDELTGTGQLEFGSVSGDVELTLPTSLDADLEMSTVSGNIDSSFPITLNGRMGRRRIEGRIGKGGRLLELSTVSGDVRLRGRGS